jgi:hypothetical protein
MHFGIQGRTLIGFEAAKAVMFAQFLGQIASHGSPHANRAHTIAEKVIKVFAL